MTRDIGKLIERVEAATGADREIDAHVICALFAPDDAVVEQSRINGAWCIYSGTDRSDRPRLWDRRPIGNNAAVTGSIDAAVSLVEKVRLGARWGRCIETGDMLIYTGRQNCFGTAIWKEGKGATPALSLISALLRSLQSEEPSNG